VTNNDKEHNTKLMYCFLDDYSPFTSLCLFSFLPSAEAVFAFRKPYI